ncbi:MAG: NUDIX domain-containing protein, partial [Actinomycetota bacterium]|nr:NUDIX domain-containing protein [Actinomycetota bacterium]
PGAGRWSIPGGRVERGETDADAVRREVREETGLDVVVGILLGTVQRPGPGVYYDIRDYACSVAPGAGSPRPGDDALDAVFVSRAGLRTLDLVDGLYECLDRWGVLPK